MAMRLLMLITLTLCLTSLCWGDATLRLGRATLTLDDSGRVISLLPEGGADLASPYAPPAFKVTTAEGTLVPTSVTRQGKELLVRFGEQGHMRLAVTEGSGFAWLKVTELSVPGTVERLQLFCLPVKGLETVASTINACYNELFATAVMATEINVRARPVARRPGGGNHEGCSHTFEPVTDSVRQGKTAARYSATSERGDNAGWTFVSRSFPMPLDLRGCRAIRVWVYGDGGGQQLKIQLGDNRNGYRDDYIPIDFTGWKQVVCEQPSLNTLHYDGVTRIGFYYNGLPAKKSVSCLIDQVEAVIGEGENERVITLEDFEDPGSDLWPFEGARLFAETEKRFGIQPAGVGIIACPRPEFEATIERFERASGLPSPRPGGVWGKRSPWVKRSYLFITRFSESDTDDVIAFAKRGRFDMILIDQGSWCASTGHYAINTRNFPRGLDSLRDTVARFKRAGFKVGLHYLAPSIYPPDPYLTPVPDPRLVKDAHAVLAGDVDEKADFIPTTEAPEGFPAEDGGYRGSGAVIQIGDELIQYRERSMEPPYGFRGCTRGLHGTKPAAHKQGARVSHLLKSYGYFLYDMDTSLIDEVAENLARVVNTCQVDMVYWDGSERLQGDHWYYNAKLHKAFYDRFRNKNMLLQASSHSHYSWHIVSRNASADGHGDLKGYLDQRTPGFTWFRNNLMPLDIGWYYVYNTDATTDMFEYVLNKSLAYGASISLQTSPQNIREHPYIDQIVDLIAAYEELRLGGKVPETTLARLREMQKDYHLVGQGKERALQRVIYEPWRDITTLDGKSNAWEVEIKEGPCKVGVDLQVVRAAWSRPGRAYYSPQARILESFDSLAPYLEDPKNDLDTLVVGPGKAGWTHAGVTQELRSVAEDAREGGRCAVYTATSTLSGQGGWSCVGRVFDPPLDLSWHKGIGFWLRGDGKGGRFKLQLRDGEGATDYYIDNNYEGWRYHQLPRPQEDPIDYSKVRYLAFYYNVLPGKTTITCAIDDVKALPELDEITVENPRLEIDGKPLAWSVTLRDGQALSYLPGQATRLTGGGAARGTTLPSPTTLTLPPGRYSVRFTTPEPLTGVSRVRLTLQPEERLPIE
ncbi:MAG: hypothetical protein GX785_01975 [Armatimonadetes bacterium]|nr:hypothetical protein [Armatimonadota bacterium]